MLKNGLSKIRLFFESRNFRWCVMCFDAVIFIPTPVVFYEHRSVIFSVAWLGYAFGFEIQK